MAKGTLQISLLWILIWRNYLDGPRVTTSVLKWERETETIVTIVCVYNLYSRVLTPYILHLKTNYVSFNTFLNFYLLSNHNILYTNTLYSSFLKYCKISLHSFLSSILVQAK